MTKSGNTNAQKGDSKRIPWYGMVDTTTKDAIRRLASDLGLSQSEVVDRAMQALAWMIETSKFIIEDEVETAMKEESK